MSKHPKRSNGLTCTVKCFHDTLENPPSLGSTVTVKHNGCHSTGTLKNPVYWREKADVQSNSNKVPVKGLVFELTCRVLIVHLIGSSLRSCLKFSILRSLQIGIKWRRKRFTSMEERGCCKSTGILCTRYGIFIFVWQDLRRWVIATPMWSFTPGPLKREWVGVSGRIMTTTGIEQRLIRKLRRKFCDWLGVALGHTSMEDWYRVTKEDIVNNGGGGLISVYQASPSKALLSIYPEHNWDLTRLFDKNLSLLFVGKYWTRQGWTKELTPILQGNQTDHLAFVFETHTEEPILSPWSAFTLWPQKVYLRASISPLCWSLEDSKMQVTIFQPVAFIAGGNNQLIGFPLPSHPPASLFLL